MSPTTQSLTDSIKSLSPEPKLKKEPVKNQSGAKILRRATPEEKAAVIKSESKRQRLSSPGRKDQAPRKDSSNSSLSNDYTTKLSRVSPRDGSQADLSLENSAEGFDKARARKKTSSSAEEKQNQVKPFSPLGNRKQAKSTRQILDLASDREDGIDASPARRRRTIYTPSMSQKNLI